MQIPRNMGLFDGLGRAALEEVRENRLFACLRAGYPMKWPRLPRKPSCGARVLCSAPSPLDLAVHSLSWQVLWTATPPRATLLGLSGPQQRDGSIPGENLRSSAFYSHILCASTREGSRGISVFF